MPRKVDIEAELLRTSESAQQCIAAQHAFLSALQHMDWENAEVYRQRALVLLEVNMDQMMALHRHVDQVKRGS